jgi:threonine aldolase
MIDLRSDTVTQPTQKMREAMYNAAVGDDVYEDDPTINELEARAAELVGKEAALFVPSGTMGNQIAVYVNTNRGDEIIMGDIMHVLDHEVGGAAALASVQIRTVPLVNGEMNLKAVELAIRGNDIHEAETKLICLETALCDGRVMPLENIRAIKALAVKHGLFVHLDGARLFNAAISLGVDAKEITACTDTVQFCLSKGLCAPVGSILAGPKDFIIKARKVRKLFGGGMRQVGFLGAAGLVAINEMIPRLAYDNKNAKTLATELSKIPGVELDLDSVHVNMVFFSIKQSGISDKTLHEELLKRGIKTNEGWRDINRMVTHYGVSEEDVFKTATAVKEILATAPKDR